MIWTKQSCSVVEAGIIISWKLSLNRIHSGLKVIFKKCVEEHAFSELQVGKEFILEDKMSHQSSASTYPSPLLPLLQLPDVSC